MDNPAVYWPRPRNHCADDRALFRMSFGMMLATPGRGDRLCVSPVGSAWWRLDMVVEASYAVIRNRIRFRTQRSVRALNTAYGRVLSIIT